MANRFQSTEWIIDTPSATDILTTDPVRVKAFRWVGATTAGHQCVVTDQANLVKWATFASGANYVESDNYLSRPAPTPINGLKVPIMQSGSLFIEFI